MADASTINGPPNRRNLRHLFANWLINIAGSLIGDDNDVMTEHQNDSEPNESSEQTQAETQGVSGRESSVANVENGPNTTWIHVHVPKAGGSTLRQVFNRNFDEGFYNSNSLLETKQYTSEEVSEIVRCHPWLKCFSDHKLSFDLPYDHSDVKVMAIGFVRDPVERFISRYFFHRNFEEVACIAQRMSFREFATEELINGHAHPQTNSQIYFLNGGRSFDDMSLIEEAIATGHAYLFPIERFDEACICLERLFPESFTDLSYVRTNVSKKDTSIDPDDQLFVADYLAKDQPVWDLANNFLNQTIRRIFESEDEKITCLEAFRELCSRRYSNFKAPRPAGQGSDKDQGGNNEIGSSSIRNRKTVGNSSGSAQSEDSLSPSRVGDLGSIPKIKVTDGDAMESDSQQPSTTPGN